MNGGLSANRQKFGQTILNDLSSKESSLSNFHQTIFINNHQKQFKKQRLKNQKSFDVVKFHAIKNGNIFPSYPRMINAFLFKMFW